MEAWTHYNEWGLITHNAVLKCGQRELDLVKRYATHDYDSVLELYYAKARFYDAHDRRFTAVDPILDPSQYDLREYVQNPVQLVQYLYVGNEPLVYIDPTGEMAATTLILTGLAAGSAMVVTYVNLQNYFRSSQGQTIVQGATKFVADSITYTGNAISSFVSDVLSGKIGFVHTITITTRADIHSTVQDTTAGVADGAAKTINSYMAKAGCDIGEQANSKSDSQNGNQKDTSKDDQSTSNSSSRGKDWSTVNGSGSQKGDGGNGGLPLTPNQNPKDFESSKQNGLTALERFQEAWEDILSKSTFDHETGKGKLIYNRNDSNRFPTAKTDFENLGLDQVTRRVVGGDKVTYTGVTPDGRTVNLHISSIDEGHPWTLELGNVKIRYR